MLNVSDKQKAQVIVEQLAFFETEQTAKAFYYELRNVKSSNSTRGYLKIVLKSLCRLPFGLIEEYLLQLSQDKSQSYRMRAKYREILDEKQYR